MFLKRLSLAALAFLSAASFATADILVLTNGERKEGEILNETPDVVRMRYQLTPKISDEKDFPRADIAEIIRQSPAELDLKREKLKEVIPTKDMMGADEYERLIQDRLRPFVSKYPGTPEATEVEQIIKELQAEKEKVVSGQLKVDGKWLSPDEVKRDDYNIRAYKLRAEIKSTAASPKLEDWVAALRIYDRFIDQSSGFFASTHYPLLVPEMLEILGKYESELLRMIREQPILLKNQKDGVARMIEPDKSRTEAEIKRRLDEWKTEYDAEKRARLRWLVPYKLDDASLNEAHKAVVAERAKLNQLDLDALAKQNELLVAVFRYLAEENAVEAEAALENATKSSAVSKQEYSRIFADLRGKVTLLKNEIQRKRNAQRTFNQSVNAVGSGTGPITDDRVTKALADAETPKPPAAEDPNAPIGAAPAPTPAPAAPAPAPAAATPAPAPAPAVAVEEESGFIKYILIGGGALLAVLLIALVMQKKKQA